MATLSIVRPSPAPLTIHIAGADPCFGLGERFYQAALSDTHFDVRPADRSGEPGHNWSYVAIPLVYTPTGLGLYADTVFDTNFNFNAAGSAFDLRVANTPVTFYVLSAAQSQGHPASSTPRSPAAPKTRPYGPSDPGSPLSREEMRYWRRRRESAPKAFQPAPSGFSTSSMSPTTWAGPSGSPATTATRAPSTTLSTTWATRSSATCILIYASACFPIPP